MYNSQSELLLYSCSWMNMGSLKEVYHANCSITIYCFLYMLAFQFHNSYFVIEQITKEAVYWHKEDFYNVANC